MANKKEEVFKSSGDAVYPANFGDVLNVLGGKSDWQAYIAPNLEVARKKIGDWTMKVESADDFKWDMHRLGEDVVDDRVAGVTDKMKGQMLLRDSGGDSKHSSLLPALHECVHWVSHPATQGERHSTAIQSLGIGLLEGLVEMVTEDILTAQDIKMPGTDQRGHPERLSMMKELLSTDGIDLVLLACLLFKGHTTEFDNRIKSIFLAPDWTAIKNLAIINRNVQGIARIQRSRIPPDRGKSRTAAAAH